MKNLKKVVAVLLVLAVAAIPLSAGSAVAKEKDPIVSGLFSLFLPGFGEWYNAGSDGDIPVAELCTGVICPCVTLSSIIDAYKGCTNDQIRFDFWTKPQCTR